MKRNLTRLVATLLFVSAMGGSTFGVAAAEPDLSEFAQAAASCPDNVTTCLGLHLYIATDEGVPVVQEEWVVAQVANSNRLFAPLGVGFEVVKTDPLPESLLQVADKTARDRLGHARWQKGTIHVFVTGRLDNVDEPGEIYGVHWRDRKQTSHRWIILSKIAWPHTLVHELGHYFGLKHSKTPKSIMTKGGTPRVAVAMRVFTSSQQKTMKRRLARYLRTGVLRARQRP